MALTDAFRSMRAPALPGYFSPDALLERWRDALTACLPARLRRALAPRDHRPVLVLRDSKATLCQGNGEERQILGHLEPDSPGTWRALLADTARGRRRTVIELSEDQVISKTVSFPAQVRNNLAQVLGYEIDRLTPFRPDQICFDYRLRDATSRGAKIAVDLVLCRRDLVQDWLERLRVAGAPVEEVTWDGAWPKANLLPRGDRPQGGAKSFSTNKLLFLLVIGLTASVMAGPIWQKNRHLEELVADLGGLKARAEEVYELRNAIELAYQGSVAVLQRKSEQPQMIDLLRALTERLPDDTWVQNLDYRDGDVQIRGESSQAATLIGILEQVSGFADVAFRSPVVRVAATGKERFHISFKLSREDAP